MTRISHALPRERSTRIAVTRTRPCQICDGTDGCSRGHDGLFFCRRQSGDVPGFVYLGQAKGDAQFALIRLDGDPHLNRTGHHQRSVNGSPKKTTPITIDWAARQQKYVQACTHERHVELADALGLPLAAIDALLPVGWMDQGPHLDKETDKPLGPCWTFGVTDAGGHVKGVDCRYVSGKKMAMGGGQRGLIVPPHWRDGTAPILVVEGPSDVAAAYAMGLPVVGRPSNMSGVDDLAQLLRDVSADRDIIVMGEYDPRPDGRWPGLEGAIKVSSELSAMLGRPVPWALPPDGAKDLRVWAHGQRLTPTSMVDEWQEAGEKFVSLLRRNQPKTIQPEPGRESTDQGFGLATTTLSTIRPEPIRWLVPGYLPAGKLVLLAGDGGNGKSAYTLRLAADITRGRPCMGLNYDDAVMGEVMLVSCEDDFADTVVPRLLAAGADLSKIHRVDGVQAADGKPTSFNLSHYEDISAELKRRQAVRRIVVDPAGSFIGRTGGDDHTDSELRSLLDPLAQLAAEHRVTVLLVKHLSKGATAKAVHKVSGSTGYVNAVRAAFIVVPDLDDQERKLFLPLKFNIARKPLGLAYRTQGLDADDCLQILDKHAGHLDEADRQHLAEQLFRVVWDGTTNVDADTAVGAGSKPAEATKVDAAAEWILEYLSECAQPSDEIVSAGRNAGFSRDTMFRAKKKLAEVKAAKLGASWYWGIGPQTEWKYKLASAA